jgi:septum formation protein
MTPRIIGDALRASEATGGPGLERAGQRAPRLVLASSSPRRRELLERAGYAFVVRTPRIDERARGGEPPEASVERLAREKARYVAHRSVDRGEVVVGADTLVVLGERTLGKPDDVEEAASMLLALAGRVHRVLTGVCLIADASEVAWVEESRVEMAPIDPADARAYARGGEPMDKAGAYALQGEGARFVRAVHGSRTNVIGLPLEALERHLRALGLGPR